MYKIILIIAALFFIGCKSDVSEKHKTQVVKVIDRDFIYFEEEDVLMLYSTAKWKDLNNNGYLIATYTEELDVLSLTDD